MRLLVPIGTRPEIVKLAPVVHLLRNRGFDVRVVATGQHNDAPGCGGSCPMRSRTRASLMAVAVVIVAVAGFAVLNGTARAVERSAAVAVLRLFIDHGDVTAAGPTTVLLVPDQRAAFHVLITPSCSALASLIAFVCLAPSLPPGRTGARVIAVAAASALVITGNIIRIAASMAMGLHFGRTSLVLFHDWVGAMFTIVYTLGGFIVMLALLLPKRSASVSQTPTEVALAIP